MAATVLVPLYYYPLTEKTWQPLYDAITSYPYLKFLVIVNPNSGPGDAPLPGKDYVREVPKLNAFPNVQTIGYVKVDWCRRPIEESFKDVQLYADWAEKHSIPGLFVEGIFVDETPNHYSPEHLDYLEYLGAFIKNSKGLGGNRMVMHNPGTPPDATMMPIGTLGAADAICTCEEPWSRFCDDEVQQRLAEYHLDAQRSAYQISGIPPDMIREVVEELSLRGAYIFATDLDQDFYESFSNRTWHTFVSAVAELRA